MEQRVRALPCRRVTRRLGDQFNGQHASARQQQPVAIGVVTPAALLRIDTPLQPRTLLVVDWFVAPSEHVQRFAPRFAACLVGLGVASFESGNDLRHRRFRNRDAQLLESVETEDEEPIHIGGGGDGDLVSCGRVARGFEKTACLRAADRDHAFRQWQDTDSRESQRPRTKLPVDGRRGRGFGMARTAQKHQKQDAR